MYQTYTYFHNIQNWIFGRMVYVTFVCVIVFSHEQYVTMN